MGNLILTIILIIVKDNANENRLEALSDIY